MTPLGYPLLADENIAPDVVHGMRVRDLVVCTVAEEGLIGCNDRDVLGHATSQNRVVLTHDRAFGQSAIRAGTPFVGIICLRPGHISAAYVLATIDALRSSRVDVEPPFVVVAERRDTTIRVRVRTGPPW